MNDEKKPEDYVKRDPEQRQLYVRAVEILKLMATKTKLAIMKYILRSIADEDKDENN